MVIGGGLAGLSAGCYALENDIDVTIVEHNVALGGVCTAWHRGPYPIDGCIHWLTGGPFLRIVAKLGDFAAEGIAVDADGSAHFAAAATSFDSPTPNALQPTPSGNGDAVVLKLAAASTDVRVRSVRHRAVHDGSVPLLRQRIGNPTGTRHSVSFALMSMKEVTCVFQAEQ